MDIFISTTGLISTVILDDLGGRELIHPVTNLEFTLEYSLEEIRDSASLDDALLSNYLTMRDETGLQYNSVTELDDFSTDADSIVGKVVDSTDIGNNKVLTYNEISDTIIYSDPATSSLYYDIIQGGKSWDDIKITDDVDGGTIWLDSETDLINGGSW